MNDLPEGLHGAYRRSELVQELGAYSVRELLQEGALVRYGKNVLVDRRYQLDLPTRAAAALLYVGPRAVLTSHTAALLYNCAAADAGTIHVLSDRKVLPRPGLAVHSGSYEEADVLELHGLRTLALEIVIADMLCSVHRPIALACADQAFAGLEPRLRDVLREEVSKRLRTRPDPRGTRRARVLLDLATGVPESPAESGMLLVLYDAGLPVPELQFSVLDFAGRERYRLDFAWAEPRVALEYDGFEAHEDRAENDAARDADLRSRGWIVVRATASDLRKPAQLVRTLRAAFAQRRYAA